MSEGRTATGAAQRVGSGTTRLVRAGRALPHESRLAAGASVALFLTLFLPWYQVTLIASAKASKLESASAAITGWGAFSFVEAAVLLVAVGVLVLLFQRAEGRAFHLPGGDGGVITAAGLWACLLIVWRIFDKQGASTNGPSATSSGVEWGIFIALATAAFLAYAGSRIRAAHRPEPPLPGEDHAPAGSSAAAITEVGPSRRDTPPPPRRRARPPRPVAADRHDPADRHDRTNRHDPADRPDPVRAPDPPPAPASPPGPDRPRRRRATAAELFERVVPEDPPTMPFGRAKRSDVDLTIRMARLAKPAPRHDPTPSDEQPTTPHRNREDDTLRLGEDATLPLDADETLPLGRDETLPLGRDATLPRDERPKRH
jgi:hypothetical protein